MIDHAHYSLVMHLRTPHTLRRCSTQVLVCVYHQECWRTRHSCSHPQRGRSTNVQRHLVSRVALIVVVSWFILLVNRLTELRRHHSQSTARNASSQCRCPTLTRIHYVQRAAERGGEGKVMSEERKWRAFSQWWLQGDCWKRWDSRLTRRKNCWGAIRSKCTRS